MNNYGGHRSETSSMTLRKQIEDLVVRRPACWRAGQAAWNALSEHDPETAEELRGTLADPYFDDERLPAFWDALDRSRETTGARE